MFMADIALARLLRYGTNPRTDVHDASKQPDNRRQHGP